MHLGVLRQQSDPQGLPPLRLVVPGPGEPHDEGHPTPLANESTVTLPPTHNHTLTLPHWLFLQKYIPLPTIRPTLGPRLWELPAEAVVVLPLQAQRLAELRLAARRGAPEPQWRMRRGGEPEKHAGMLEVCFPWGGVGVGGITPKVVTADII